MMSLARRSIAVLASAAAMTLLTTGGFPLGAQESSTAKSQTTKAKQAEQADAPASTPTDSSTSAKPTGKTAPPDVTHRVPPGYSKLGLTDEQKEKLYKIQAEYYSKIQNLRKQVSDMRDKREKEFESVLTNPQKRLLAEAAQQKKAVAEAKKAAAVKAAAKEKASN
jgi:LTXXQ motif family protein